MAQASYRRIDAPTKLRLAKEPTDVTGGETKESARAKIEKLAPQVEELFDKLTFAGANGILIVLQAMDAGGKDGAIRHILRHCHAQTARVASFKVPTPVEAAHDFLWRVHAQVPARGEIVLFNRSHYEDVLVTRVHGLVDDAEAERRFERIREFERLLHESGTILVKVFLHISKEEQEERLRDREGDPNAAWKLSSADWKERELWNQYQRVYEDAIGATAASHAPWLVVPADRKWHRDLVLTRVLLETLESRAKEWDDDLARLGDAKRAELAAYRASG